MQFVILKGEFKTLSELICILFLYNDRVLCPFLLILCIFFYKRLLFVAGHIICYDT